jgi:hypothetical protein
MWIDSLEPTSGPTARADDGPKEIGRRYPRGRGNIARGITASLSNTVTGERP